MSRAGAALPGAMYWVLALVLLAFGFVTMFSVGAPFSALGLALIILAPFRSSPTTFWSAISGVIAFFVGYVLVAPLGCTARATVEATSQNGASVGSQAAATTVCSNLLGIDYSGTGTYNPPLWPALIAGLATATVVVVVVRALVARATGHGASRA